MEIEFCKLPTNVTFVDNHRTPRGSKCRTICFTEKGELFVSCDDNIDYHTEGMGERTTQRTSEDVLSAVALSSGELLTLLADGSIQKMPYPFHDEWERFLEIEDAIRIAVSNDNLFILTRSAEEDAITSYNMVTREQNTHRFEDTKFVSIACASDGDILVVDQQKGILYKYKISNNQEFCPKLIWSRDGLQGAYSVCVDQQDQIYVAADEQMVYMVNDDGKT